MKINCIVFGLSGLDTAPIVRAMKKHPKFDKVIWFGVVDGADINTFEAYKYQADYDYSIPLPEEYISCMQEALGNFLVSSCRRNETFFNGKTYTLGFGSTYEYLHHFSRYCYLIYDLIIKNQINLIIVDGVPHTSIDVLLSQAAKYFNIRTLFLYQHCIANRFMYFTDLINRKVDFSLYYSDKARPVRNKSSEYKVTEPTTPFFMEDFSRYFYDKYKFIADIRNILKNEESKSSEVTRTEKKIPFSSFSKKLQHILTNFKLDKEHEIDIDNTDLKLGDYLTNYFDHFEGDLDKLESLSSALLKFVKYAQYEKRLADLSQKTVDLTVPYVYFPLSFQPESTTECLGGHFADILTAVEKIRCLIPPDWKIYLKDHVIQYELARDKIFFERLKSIPNLILVDRFHSSFELIRNSQFVATLNGTVGWEAIHMGKKAVTFGGIYYQGLPGVFLYSQSLKLDDILNTSIDKEILEDAINTLIGRMEIGVVNADYSAIVENFNEETNANYVLDFIQRFFFEQHSSTPSNLREYTYEAS
ncbi:TPA: capsule biosynthesis protein [Legionella pneumophila]|uniref:capsular polysaccharide export protein, LipB/KpsS family n=1 Tax=Legionella pneumophila TaxID=446 RepID=UPI00048C54A6|nr:capsule biosynthesis protein [Legionella pneumophila]HAT9803829.1 capsule biosynthesis protein [Legionella pneumophila subsp. pneumophila]MDW8987926.1 capsule biosynthesis protein [Legionella pneumophila]MDW8993566.1 capsule biosynthesis protein [Legionella pneumophila]MDW8999992.1 capsule biosynthesis protein [Legionella pneumophila]MDW9002982.1 capsule biosynthesis protein [Legionella pneumophila]